MARAWVFGDDLDTDQMVPGRYAPFMVGQDKFHTYTFCDARPGFAKEVRPGDILVGGENFGCGSSREYAVDLVKDGDEVTLDVVAGVLRGPRDDAALRPLAPFAREILDAGGVVAY